jgi:phospholipid N-methyltransferase
MVNLAYLDEARVIIELGAGDGRVTRAILARMHPDARLIVLEMDPKKGKILQEEFSSQCEVHTMSAAHLDQIIGHGEVDVVISTLPLGSISLEGVHAILQSIQSALHSWGRYIQHQYVMPNLREVKQYFVMDHIKWEPRNFYPTYIYVTHKK